MIVLTILIFVIIVDQFDIRSCNHTTHEVRARLVAKALSRNTNRFRFQCLAKRLDRRKTLSNLTVQQAPTNLSQAEKLSQECRNCASATCACTVVAWFDTCCQALTASRCVRAPSFTETSATPAIRSERFDRSVSEMRHRSVAPSSPNRFCSTFAKLSISLMRTKQLATSTAVRRFSAATATREAASMAPAFTRAWHAETSSVQFRREGTSMAV
mmetsp:Transcript_168063/g.539688  ORF Transcript_168063/g.539688 Transcript_168063/m.539688 type:complete len:214 (-) Transcript_168063:60-701(-)